MAALICPVLASSCLAVPPHTLVDLRIERVLCRAGPFPVYGSAKYLRYVRAKKVLDDAVDDNKLFWNSNETGFGIKPERI